MTDGRADTLGGRIRQLRIAKGLSQADLAALVGVDHSYLSHLESGQRGTGITVDFARRLSAALSVGLDDLLPPAEEPPAEEPPAEEVA